MHLKELQQCLLLIPIEQVLSKILAGCPTAMGPPIEPSQFPRMWKEYKAFPAEAGAFEYNTSSSTVSAFMTASKPLGPNLTLLAWALTLNVPSMAGSPLKLKVSSPRVILILKNRRSQFRVCKSDGGFFKEQHKTLTRDKEENQTLSPDNGFSIGC